MRLVRTEGVDATLQSLLSGATGQWSVSGIEDPQAVGQMKPTTARNLPSVTFSADFSSVLVSAHILLHCLLHSFIVVLGIEPRTSCTAGMSTVPLSHSPAPVFSMQITGMD